MEENERNLVPTPHPPLVYNNHSFVNDRASVTPFHMEHVPFSIVIGIMMMSHKCQLLFENRRTLHRGHWQNEIQLNVIRYPIICHCELSESTKGVKVYIEK